MADDARPDDRRPRVRAPLPVGALARRIGDLSLTAAATGVLLIALGTLSATFPPAELYRDAFSGYDPPFSVVAGILFIALAPRLYERTSVAWLVALLAPVLTCSAAALSPNPFSLASAAASVALVSGIYPYRSGFYRNHGGGQHATELAVVVAGLLSLLFGTVGARWLGGEFSPTVKGWAEALYFTVTTVSTNGSSIAPMTNTARLFVVALILLGVGTFLSAIVVVFVPFIERRLSGLSRRFEEARLHELQEHVIVCGASPEAHATARALRASGARAVIVSADSQALELLRNEGFRTHLGDPSSEGELRAVGIDRARAVIVAQASDAENLLTVITARALQPGVRIVAIATSDDTLPKLKRAGANEAVSVVGVAAQLMSSAALQGTPSGAR